VQSSIREEVPKRERGTVISPSLNPNGNRFWSERAADQIVKEMVKHRDRNSSTVS